MLASPHALTGWLLPALIALATVVPFLTVFRNDFVEWDDFETLIENPHYRGFAWPQLSWMWTTFHMGHFQPLSWLTFALDYLIWGMNPVGYHLTNLVLHAINAMLFFVLARRLLLEAFPLATEAQPRMLGVSAAAAALLFAIHPLRVESVTWATERRDVLAGLFFLATLYLYLTAHKNALPARRRTRLALALAAYFLSLTAKATAITLPAILLLLDVYPLRRLSGHWRSWFAADARKIFWEKTPFLVIAVLFAAVAIWAQQSAGALRPAQQYFLSYRLGQAAYGIIFYLWKSLLPIALSPLYELPNDFHLWTPLFVLFGAVAITITVGLFALRQRWPAGIACWLYYLVMLAPVLGFAQSGPQLVADRYSYLSCMSLALLAAGALFYVRRDGNHARSRLARVSGAVAVTGIVGFAALTWRQTGYWRNTETLWTRALDVDPNSSLAHYNLARYIARQGRYQEAVLHYQRALAIRPADADTLNNLGLLVARNGELERASEFFTAAVKVDPGYGKAFFNMARVLSRQGRLDEAIQNYRQALKLNPDESEILIGISDALIRQGQLEEGTGYLQKAVALHPELADAHVALARALVALGNKTEAEKHYQEAVRLLKAQNSMTPSAAAASP